MLETPFFLTSIRTVKKKTERTLETNEQFYFKIPGERANHILEVSSHHRITQQCSRFSFRLSSLPLLLISTNLRNRLHFITSIFYHPCQAFPRPPPQCILLPNTAHSPIRPFACVSSHRCLIRTDLSQLF